MDLRINLFILLMRLKNSLLLIIKKDYDLKIFKFTENLVRMLTLFLLGKKLLIITINNQHTLKMTIFFFT